MERTEYTHDPATPHGRARREQIIVVATRLFHQKGFHATGIDEIGAAAGITGPGIYRHFVGKNEILMAVLDRMWMRLREGIDTAATLPPGAALDHLIDTHVGLAVHRRAEFTLLVEDLRFLPDDYQALARQNRNTYRDAWANAIVAEYPSMTMGVARLVTGSTWRLSAGADDAMRSSGCSDADVEPLLVAMSRAAVAAASGDV